ncbi:primase-helicase family protein [Burkholderia territorii]|uniref:primase-helicase family protein n=1 Tax=Burkholderia territorii TaxID=1503055 RepID=UPI000A83D5E5|nr:primase-helicase family protein [Burkholderia territorii]
MTDTPSSDGRRRPRAPRIVEAPPGYSYDDFYAYLPTHGYLHVPSHEIWPASSVDVKLPPRDRLKPSHWLDLHRPVMQLVWVPGAPSLIRDRVMQDAGWQSHPDACLYNLYTPPVALPGQAPLATPWRDHLVRLYPDECEHIANWLAHATQHPGIKINHGLMLGGAPGIGKDTLLEAVRLAVGPHNFADITPRVMQGRFNGWVRNVIVRVSEVRDLGDLDRYAFYEHCKPLLAAPPDVVRVDEKNLREYYVANACGVIFTTNHLTDGLYLPADDRRHFVAWSNATAIDFDEDYWRTLWNWYSDGGLGHVVAWLHARDLSNFDPKAPPPRTAAFWTMVQTSEAPERGEMRDLIDLLGNPPAFTLGDLITGTMRHHLPALEAELTDRRNQRALPHWMERVGYSPVRNPDADDGLFRVAGRRVVIYALRALTFVEQVRVARQRAKTGELP